MDRKQYQKEWHQRNGKRRRAIAKQRKFEIRSWFREYKSKLKCERCGFQHPAAIDFHHKNREDKVSGVCYMVTEGFCKETILAEIAKCEVLCANCHRIEHDDTGV